MFWFRATLGLIFFAHSLLGGVVLDGSFGTRGALPGPNFMITAPMGRLVNTNLFQSFSQFNLNSSQSATFTGPANVQNILSRVTSGGPSSIDGPIDSDIHGANLFFMNPAGVIFGRHAQLDVSGSFAVTTASYLKLVGGGRFNANLGGQDTLTSAPVSAFGFLDQTPAAVSITGSNSTRDSSGNIIPGPGLNIAPHKSFSVVAGDIAMNAGTIIGRGSRVNLVSVKSPGEVQLDATAINSAVDVTQFTALGTINLANLALIDTSGPGGGPVVIRGGNLYLNNSQIFSETMGAIQGGAIDIALLDDLQIVNLGFIVAETVGGGKGGNLGIHAGSLSIHGTTTPLTFTGIGATSGGISVPSNPDATGDGGNLTLTVEQALSIGGGGQISTTTFSRGKAGNLSVHARSISIHGVIHGKGTPYPLGSPYPLTQIASASATGATGDGGNVTITVDDALSVVAGSDIGASTFSRGNAGNLSIQAGSIFIDGMADVDGNGTAIASQSLINPPVRHIITGATGNAGDVTITVNGALNIVEGSGINCSTETTGQGGNITIHAGSLSIDSSLAPDLLTGIVAAAYDVNNNKGSTGNAGNVTITVVHALNIFGSNGGNVRAHIFDGTQGSGPNSKRPTGHGGKLSIQAGSLSIDGGPEGSHAGISTETLGSGNAGSATVTVDGTLNIVRGGEISSSTSWTGNGGPVNVTAGLLLIDGAGSGSEARTGIFAEAADGSAGRGGEVAINTHDFLLQNGGSVAALSVTPATAGSVRLEVGRLNLESGSIVSSANTSSGPAGSVFIDTIGPMQLSGGSSISTSAIDGGAGTIRVNTADLTLTDGGEISSSTSGKGNGGSVSVFANSLLIDRGSSNFTGITAEAKHGSSGNAGNAIVRAGSLTIAGAGEISSNTFGEGNGGNVGVTANSLLIDGVNSGIFAVAGSGSNGIGGDVTVTAAVLSLRNEGSVSAASFTPAAAGSVSLNLGMLGMASDSSISSANTGFGSAGSVFISTTRSMALSGASSISTSARHGNAGDVMVTTGDLAITDGAQVSSSTFGGGNGGNVSVIADSLFVDRGTSKSLTGITAEAERGSSGNAGSVMVRSGDLTVTGGGEISSNTLSQGNGGEVGVSASSLLIQNGGSVSAISLTSATAGSVTLTLGTLKMDSNSSISSANTGSGAAGGVSIDTTGSVKLRHESNISTSADVGNAGSIELISGGLIRLRNGSRIAASAGADGGNIHITAPDLVYLTDSEIKATAGDNGGSGTGGNITIDPQFIVLNNSLISANAAHGQGGNINLISDFFFNSNSLITATGTTNGTINISAPELDLGAELITLPTSLLSAENQLQERCTELLQGDFSSFISIGRGGTEPEPDELQEEF